MVLIYLAIGFVLALGLTLTGLVLGRLGRNNYDATFMRNPLFYLVFFGGALLWPLAVLFFVVRYVSDAMDES